MLRLLVPPNAALERKYIAEVLFHRFLGLQVEICPHNRTELLVTDDDNKCLILDDSFFSDLHKPFLRKDKVPALPLRCWSVAESELGATLVGPDLPVLFGNPFPCGTFVAIQESEIRLGIDVLGSAFFMMSRYEELISSERDMYDRFPARASLAYKANFLQRPIVDEYVEILWHCLKRLWRGLLRKERSFRVLLSHDVDVPFLEVKKSLSQVARNIAGDVLKRRNPLAALKRAAQWGGSRLLGPEYDPAYTFNYMMEQAEKHGLRSAFYFIPSLKAGPPDHRYGIHDREIERLISEIHARGHEVGYHGSIETYNNLGMIQDEVRRLRDACEKAGARQGAFGGRQHYLRIAVPITLRYLAAAGLVYDATLGYADCAGFRCGTCSEYPFYDLVERRLSGITERPLILMECTVFDPEYMGLGVGGKALEVMLRLADTCRRFSGDFTLLWHNDRLVSMRQRRFFEDVLELLCGN